MVEGHTLYSWSHTQIKLKFKVSNMNILPTKIWKYEDLKWYISVNKEIPICITILKIELPIVNMKKDTNFQIPLFVATKVYRNVQLDEFDQMQSVLNDNVKH